MLQYIKNKFSSPESLPQNLEIPSNSQKMIDIHDDIFSLQIFFNRALSFFFFF